MRKLDPITRAKHKEEARKRYENSEAGRLKRLEYKRKNAKVIADKRREYDKEYSKINRARIAARKRLHREANREEFNEKNRLYCKRPHVVARRKEYSRRYNKLFPDKIRAGRLIRSLVTLGKLKRPTACPQCKKKGLVYAHHKDYSKPLEVTWLCPKCHIDVHFNRLCV